MGFESFIGNQKIVERLIGTSPSPRAVEAAVAGALKRG